MGNEQGQVGQGNDFAGTCTRLMLSHVAAKAGQDAVAEVLRLAGEIRSVEELNDESGWSSYGQFRALAEAAAGLFGDQHCFDDLHEHVELFDTTMPETTEMLQDLDGPGELLLATEQSNGIMKIMNSAGLIHQRGPTEWYLGYRLFDGLEPFPEFCSFATGIAGLTVGLFGFQVLRLEKVACMLRGDDHCANVLAWNESDDSSELRRLRIRLALAERRLDALRETVADLVSDDDLDTILRRTVTTAARAMRSPAFVLALEALPGSSQRVFAHGLDQEVASEYAEALLAVAEPGVAATGDIAAVVDVASTKRSYGRLAAIDPGHQVAEYDTPGLAAYARLAASALDSATALEVARRQAASSRTLLELSAALAEVTSVEQMSENVARATPIVVDCDTATVFLTDGEIIRVGGLYGFSVEEEAFMRALEIPATNPDFLAEVDGLKAHTRESSTGEMRSRMEASGMAAAASTPISVEGDTAGWVVVGVRDDAARLAGNPEITEQLRGLAGQAATALANARLHDRIRRQALQDGLTGLPNRTLVIDRAEQLLERARRQGDAVAALFLDLDGFKQVNDTFGHAAGDQLLRAVAGRLQSALRGSDTVGRIGGDEFVVLTEVTESGSGPEHLAERILSLLREPFRLDRTGESCTIGASIGIAIGARETANELLRDADIALYEAKSAGRGRYSVFTPRMGSGMVSGEPTEEELRQGVERSEFFVVYRPIFDLQHRSMCGMEALLRWRHPSRGVLLPEAFEPILEETHLIDELSRWMLTEVCGQAASWHADGHPIDVAVNVSANQLERANLTYDIAHALSRSGLPARSLTIEVAESTMVRDLLAGAPQLAAVRDLDVGVAVDGFGTKLSSLAYRRRLPVDALKIDRGFFDTVAEHPGVGSFAQAVVQLGESLGLRTLGEGVEDSPSLAHLAEHCDSSGGFLLARPMEADAVARLLGSSLVERDLAVPTHMS